MKKEKNLGASEKDKTGSLKLITSTQSFLPTLDVKDGILITKDGRYVKIMEFSPINFALRSGIEQTGILQQYASALRIMPASVQFKIVSRQADVSGYEREILRDIHAEENDNCRRLQFEQINMLHSLSSSQGVSRRFYLIFEYERDRSLKKSPDFEQIKYELEREAAVISSALGACGNEKISRDDDEYIMSTLWSIASRSESEKRSFKDRAESVIARHLDFGSGDLSTSVNLPMNDFIAPSVIDAGSYPGWMKIDDLYYMFCYIPSASYPETAFGGWLSILVNMGVGIDVDLWIHREPVESTQRKLQYRLRFNKIKLRETDDTSGDYDDLFTAVRSGYYLKQGMAENDDFCYFGIMVTITADSIEDLKFRYNAVRQHCLRNDLKIRPCLFQQKEAFISSLPVCRYNAGIWKKCRRNILTSSLASTYPFVSYEMTDENGILLGINSDNGSPVFVNIFNTKKYNNANIAIMGSSGSGKTYTLQCMALRLREKQIQVFIIAPLKGIEFKRACEAVGGTYVKIAPGSGQNINIMEIRPRDPDELDAESDDDGSSILMLKIQQLHAFFSLLVPDISFEEKQILDESLIETYREFGITSDNASLNDPDAPGQYRKMPVLGDLHRMLKRSGEGSKRLYNVLSRYVSGSARTFNMQTNVDLNNRYVVLDVSSLTKEMLTAGMFIALDYVWDKAKENRASRKVIFIDETWRLIGAGSSVEAAEFVLEIFKIIRGYGGAAVAATQDLNDFFALDNGRFGAGIINNSKIKMLMKTEPKEAEVVARAMDLSASEETQIHRIRRGTCLLAANTNHIFIDIKASRTEHDLITTDASDLTRIAMESRKMKKEN